MPNELTTGAGERVRPAQAKLDKPDTTEQRGDADKASFRSEAAPKLIEQLQKQVAELQKVVKIKTKDEILRERRAKVRASGETAERKPYFIERLDEPPLDVTPGEGRIDEATLDELAGARMAKRMKEAPRAFGSLFFERGEDLGSVQSDSPIPSTYRLGAGDALKIIVWSEMGDETVYDVTVNPEGQVYVPIIGVIGVQGLTIGQFEETIIGSLSGKFKHFKGQVTLTKVRTLQIFVTGEAAKPGALMVNALSTAFHALYRAGGPTDKGSMRRIKLIRDGVAVGTIDLYKYFLSGDKTQDMSLETGDTLFIPPILDRVQISGEVLRPAIYELLENRTLDDVLAMAGGMQASAYNGRIKIFRWQKSERRKIMDVVSAAAPKTFQLMGGDEVFIERALEELGNQVRIEGAVRRPGEYAFVDGTSIQDLVKHAGGILEEETALNVGQIVRKAPEGNEVMLSFDLEKALKGEPGQNPVLKPFDCVRLFYAGDIRPNSQRLVIAGAVRRPGEYILRNGMRIRDLVMRAQGLTIDAAAEAELAQTISSGTGTEIRKLKIRDIVNNPNHPDNIPLHAFNRLNILANSDVLIEPETIILKGEVKRPGPYSLKRRGETLADVIERAGGLTSNAFPEGAVFKRRAEKLFEDQQLESAEAVQEDMFNQASHDLRADLIRSGAKISDVAGESSDIQFLEGKPGGQKISAGGAEEKTEDVAISHIAQGEKSRYSGVDITTHEIRKKQFRIPIQQAMLKAGVKPGDAMELADGDEITIPSIPVTVAIAGAVVNPSSILYKVGRSVSYYIDRVGGFSGIANHSHTVVVRANGEVIPLRRVDKVNRGDIILVPPKANLVKPNKLQDAGQIAQALGNLAVIYKVAVQK
ncbi:MAG: SLBB domain-containing protein [Candidatus Riflebacteria bacterium]|nr:SLBB domain-containing protein [Candidatus Riflebacteria bacterium]